MQCLKENVTGNNTFLIFLHVFIKLVHSFCRYSQNFNTYLLIIEFKKYLLINYQAVILQCTPFLNYNVMECNNIALYANKFSTRADLEDRSMFTRCAIVPPALCVNMPQMPFSFINKPRSNVSNILIQLDSQIYKGKDPLLVY